MFTFSRKKPFSYFLGGENLCLLRHTSIIMALLLYVQRNKYKIDKMPIDGFQILVNEFIR